MFFVADPVWEFYVKARDRRKVMCLPCWRQATERKDRGIFEAENGAAAGFLLYHPLPPGGHEELRAMSKEEVTAFFDHARNDPKWRWLENPEIREARKYGLRVFRDMQREVVA
jgi:hypothetical protein